MGVYDQYGNTQLKVGENRCLRQFNVGDKVEIPDGIYLSWVGLVVVIDGIFVAEFENLNSKWGDSIPADKALETLTRDDGG